MTVSKNLLLSTFIKMLCFVFFGIILQFGALFYYGTMVTDAQSVVDYLYNNEAASNSTLALYGMINGLIFFCIYLLIIWIIKISKQFYNRQLEKG